MIVSSPGKMKLTSFVEIVHESGIYLLPISMGGGVYKNGLIQPNTDIGYTKGVNVFVLSR